MVVIEPPGCCQADWLLVWGNEGDGSRQTGVPTIPKDEKSLGWIPLLCVNWAIFQDPGVMDRSRVAREDVQVPALMVTDRLQLDGGKQLPVNITLGINGWWFYPDLAAINTPHHPGECRGSCKTGKPIPNLQIMTSFTQGEH